MKIRVASFNVAWAGNDAKRASNSPSLAPLDPERLARSLELLAADVVSFQEIVEPAVLAGALARMSGQPLMIRDVDGAEMASRIPDEWNLGAAAFQHVVLGWRPERLQLVRWARLPGKFIREPIAARFATTAGREFVVCALHLKSPSALDGEADAKSKKKRKQECDALHDWLTAAATEDLLAAAGPRAVVAGDLNGTIDGKQQIGAEHRRRRG
jgi:endonuclease/exonuclease/phosphatase family metal-dependent hydrolase